MKNLVILGAGGLAREVHDLAYICFEKDSQFKVKGFLSDNPSDVEEMGYPPVLDTVKNYEIEPGDIFFCGIGYVYDKKKTIEIIEARGGHFINLIHPSAIISPNTKLGKGIAIKAFCILNNEVSIEDFTFVQSSVIMGHDVHIGRFCQINSFSFFAGCTRIHDLVTVNAGARFSQDSVAEEGSVIGMGSIVLRKVKKGSTVFGNPAREVNHT